MERLQNIIQLGTKELASLARDTALIGLITYAFTYAIFGPAKGEAWSYGMPRWRSSMRIAPCFPQESSMLSCPHTS